MEERLFLRAVKGGKNTKIITLNGKKMTKIPSTIGNLPGLKVLNLQKNLVSRVCSELSTLTQLTVLNLGNNLLEEVPEEVKYLTSLKNLHLFGNRINRFASGACDGLKNLILLNLNNNQLTFIPKEVSRLESLIYLSINHNQLTSIPRELCFLKNLSELQLNYNQIICIPEEIKFLKRLQKLLLARNNIEILPEVLCHLTNLRILDIAGNVIQIFPTGFQHLKLKEFYCEGNPLFLMQPVSAVKQLDVLSLQFTSAREHLKNDRGKEEKEKCALEQGLAFAILSSVHPVFGLYGSFFPAIVYAIFGMGSHVATGTCALTSLISAKAVERLVPSSSQNFTKQSNTSILGLSDFEMERIGIAASVSFLGGVIQVAMFALQLGGATFLLTEPVISAMTTGAATHVVTSQVKYLLGMKIPYISGPLGLFYIYTYVFENIKSVRLEALLLSLLSIVVLVMVKELNEQFKRKIKAVIPVDLVLVIAASFACYYTDMENTYGLDVLGHIPKGIPSPRPPSMHVLSAVITEAFGVALVGYAASLALAQESAKKFKYSVDDNQEFLAHGLSNVISSFFFCIPSAAAMGRTNGLYSTGAKTQGIWVSTYIFTICFAANVGLLFGVVCTIAMVIGRFPRTLNLIHFFSKKETQQQVKIISINNPLVFLNAKKFHADLMNIIQKEHASNQPFDDTNKCEQNSLLNSLSNGNCIDHRGLNDQLLSNGEKGMESRRLRNRGGALQLGELSRPEEPAAAPVYVLLRVDRVGRTSVRVLWTPCDPTTTLCPPTLPGAFAWEHRVQAAPRGHTPASLQEAAGAQQASSLVTFSKEEILFVIHNKSLRPVTGPLSSYRGGSLLLKDCNRKVHLHTNKQTKRTSSI
ncbi:Anion exchange transporter [Myotis brandtii]|uniref:Anion exchange transporter n=1 Tax=Myotis brandtii TaxID=109478 RepID=S7PCI5_MYOBR|nr:Anion exchange transporter [Myotis brandtii]